MAVNQFTVSENKQTRRPDVVLFINGLPFALVELKNAADENATIWSAFQQIQTYKIEGVFDKRRLLDLIAPFIVFEDTRGGALAKKMAGYHQFHAVNVAVSETVRASGMVEDIPVASGEWGEYRSKATRDAKPGDRRVGVVWHTQGSGKSLTMAFYAGRVIRESAMANPTIVVLTDRNDLDDQLFGTFSRCQDLLRQPPVQAESRADLRDKLSVDAAGWSLPRSRSFCPKRRAIAIRFFRTGGTLL